MRTPLHEPTTWVLAPGDELDIAVVPELRSRLAAAHRAGGHVVLDLQHVVFMDSSALAVVLAADRRLAATGGTLRLAHVSPRVRQVLRICGLADLVLRSPLAILHESGCRADGLVG